MIVDPQEACRGIEKGEFVPYFQPLVALRTGQLAGFEMLARWNHPKRGIVLPGEFIVAAEVDGWINKLMQDLLGQAFSHASRLPDPLTLSINVSPVQLRDLTLPRDIRNAARQSDFPLHRLIVEITESALTDNLDHAQIIAKELKQLGCRIALDDFGTGYSSLLHLQSLPFDELKVDRSFVSAMADQRDSRKIVAAVVGLGQSLDLTTVAEGVETRDQASMLLWMGCEIGQGWLFGRPAPGSELPTMIAAQREAVPTSGANPWKHFSERGFNFLPSERLAQLQAVYDGSPVGLAFLDRDMRYINLNQRLADMNGFPIEEHLGHTVEQMLPQMFPSIEPYISAALRGEAISGVEMRKIDPVNQRERTVLLSYQPARDEANEVIGVSVSIVDITDIKFAYQALRESEDLYRNMVELNPQIPWILDAHGNAIDVSSKWHEMTGLSEEQTWNYNWMNALHPDDVQPTLDALNSALKTGDPIDVEYRINHRIGGYRWKRSRGSAQFGPDGKILRWYGSIEDIEDRKQLERELLETKLQLQALLDSYSASTIPKIARTPVEPRPE